MTGCQAARADLRARLFKNERGGEFVVIVDAVDADLRDAAFLALRTWAEKQYNKVVVENPTRPAWHVLMRECPRIGDAVPLVYRNGHSFDCRRDNLCWIDEQC